MLRDNIGFDGAYVKNCDELFSASTEESNEKSSKEDEEINFGNLDTMDMVIFIFSIIMFIQIQIVL